MNAMAFTAVMSGSRAHALCFFFSSRRRHTRCSRDWSSDVCSSDLTLKLVLGLSIKLDLIVETDFCQARPMRHIINSTYISLDGVIQDPQDWPDNGKIGRASCRERV